MHTNTVTTILNSYAGASCELSDRTQKIIILKKKPRLVNIVSTLATAMQNKMLAVASKYGINSLSLSRYEIKRRIWMSFANTVVLT